MTPELIIFDMAGTTVRDDRFVHETLAMAMQTIGIQPSYADLNDVMGLPKPVAIAHLLSKSGEAATPELVNSLYEVFLGNMLAFYRNDERVQEIPGTTALFHRLKAAGILIATDTGFSRDIADVIIDRLGWRELLDASICSDEVSAGRPSPEMGFELMKQLGVTDPARVLKTGDTASDIQMGKALGCGWTVGVTSGSLTHEELMQENPTAVIGSVAELDTIWKRQ
ncbi:MAG: HAD hydrolase-like protein [Bacteroidia bacterium]|nr:HAD hydrolase-like protein [Bacteroidia bacterium]